MIIKKLFPKMLLVLGLVSIALVSMSGGVAYADEDFVRENPALKTTTTMTTDKDGWDVDTTYNPLTGETTIKKTKSYFENGHAVSITEHWTGGKKKEGYSSTRTVYFPGGGSTSTTRDAEGRTTSTTTKYSDGSETTENWNPKTGRLESQTTTEPDGSTTTVTYSHKTPCPRERAEGGLGTYGCDVTSITTYNPNNGLETSKFCDPPGLSNCKDARKVMDKALLSPPSEPPATEKPKQKPPLVPGGKDQLQAEVLQQIEDKPRGDFTGSNAKSQTGVEHPFQEKLKVQPLPVGPLPVGQKEKLGVIPRSQSAGKMYQGMDPGGKRIPTGVLEQIKKTPGVAVELNPQPLPPEPPPKISGKVQFKDKSKFQDPTVGQKEKLGVIPRSQSTGKIFQGGVAAEKKLQTQAVQQNKFKSNYQGSGTSAGSSEAFRAPK